MGPAALEQFAQRVTEQLRLLFPLQRQRNVGNLSEDVGSWTIVRRSMRQHYKLFKRTLPCETQVHDSNFKNFFHPVVLLASQQRLVTRLKFSFFAASQVRF